RMRDRPVREERGWNRLGREELQAALAACAKNSGELVGCLGGVLEALDGCLGSHPTLDPLPGEYACAAVEAVSRWSPPHPDHGWHFAAQLLQGGWGTTAGDLDSYLQRSFFHDAAGWGLPLRARRAVQKRVACRGP